MNGQEIGGEYQAELSTYRLAISFTPINLNLRLVISDWSSRGPGKSPARQHKMSRKGGSSDHHFSCWQPFLARQRAGRREQKRRTHFFNSPSKTFIFDSSPPLPTSGNVAGAPDSSVKFGMAVGDMARAIVKSNDNSRYESRS